MTDINVDEPLSGSRILEISNGISGGYAGLLLAFAGAEVTRVDLPTSADVSPGALPDLHRALHGRKLTTSAEEVMSSEALSEFDLVLTDSRYDDAIDGEARRATADVLGHLPEGVPLIDVARHRSTKTVYGAADEAPHEPATSLTTSAMSAMSWSLGAPERTPLPLPHDLPDAMTGTEAAAAACLALIGIRSAIGPTTRIWDVSGTDVIGNYVGQICSNFIPYERPWRRDGARASMSGGSYPAAMFQCSDGHISIMCRIPKEWKALLAAMGNPSWSQDPRFDDAREVARFYADEADVYLIAWIRSHTCDEMMALGSEFGFPVAPVLTLGKALALPQFHERGFITPDINCLPEVGAPWRYTSPTSQVGGGFVRREEAWDGSRASADHPLEGLRVLDLSWVWSGPMVTASLSDLGAEIVKIEGPTRPDPARLRGRAIRNGVPVDGPEYEVTPYFNQMNRGKESIALDITTRDGRELVLALAEQCDVVVENMRPGALERHGLGYSDLAARNPAIVMLSMSMMGQTGPMRGLGGYAPIMSSMAGLDSLVGYDENNLIGLYNPALGDPNGAGHAMVALLAALNRLQQTGAGCWIDLAQIEALVSVQRPAISEWRTYGTLAVPADRHAVYAPHGTWRTAGEDEWLAISARTDAERATLAEIIECPSSEPGDLVVALAAWLHGRGAAEAEVRLREAGLPAAEVQDFDRMISSPWARRREIANVVTHRYLGDQLMFPISWKHDGVAFPARKPAPLLGSATDSALARILKLQLQQTADGRESISIS